METARPFVPETRRRDRLRFGFGYEKGAKTPGFHRLDGRIPGHPDWLAEEPVSSEPVSGREFPANRENNREFCKIGADRRLRRPKNPRYSNGLEANSLRTLNREFSEA